MDDEEFKRAIEDAKLQAKQANDDAEQRRQRAHELFQAGLDRLKQDKVEFIALVEPKLASIKKFVFGLSEGDFNGRREIVDHTELSRLFEVAKLDDEYLFRDHNASIENNGLVNYDSMFMVFSLSLRSRLYAGWENTNPIVVALNQQHAILNDQGTLTRYDFDGAANKIVDHFRSAMIEGVRLDQSFLDRAEVKALDQAQRANERAAVTASIARGCLWALGIFAAVLVLFVATCAG